MDLDLLAISIDKPLILVVEDDHDIGRIVSLTLQMEGYAILLADNAIAALAVITDYPPVLIISDVMMPGLSGLELLAVLKAEQQTANIPVLMISALVADSDVQAGHTAGAQHYLKKPFTAKELLAAVYKTFEVAGVPQQSPIRSEPA